MDLNENLQTQIDFDKLKSVVAGGVGVVPCAVQHAETGEVLNIAYVNQEALDHSFQTGNATFWSTSRNELWEKGKSSGDFLKLVEVLINCEQNSLVYKVLPVNTGTCHTGRSSCYYRRLRGEQLEWVHLPS